MPDYDLGRAHGRVIIDSDTDGVKKGVKDTDREFQKLEQIAARLDKALSGARRAAVNITRGFIDMNGGIKKTIDNFQRTRSVINSFVSAATVAQRQSTRVAQSIARLHNSINVIKGIGNAFGLWLVKMDNISPVTKIMMQIYSGIQLFRAAQGIVLNLANRFNFLGVAMSGLGRGLRWIGQVTGLTTAFAFLGGRLKSVGGIIGGLLASFFQFGKTLPVVGGLFTKLGVAGGAIAARFATASGNLGHFGKTLKTVQSALSTTLGVTERVTRAFTRTAFFAAYSKVAWQGFSKAMRLVAKSVVVLAAGATALTVGMQVLGSAVMGTWDALKQLSGIASALPGLIALGGAAALTLKIALNGVGEAFKALGGDAEAFEEAIAKLSPSAQESMRALREFVPRFKEIQAAAQSALFDGLADEIREVGGPVMDVLSRGTLGVSKSFNQAARELINFTGKGQTISDLDSIFESTNTVVRNFAKSIEPLGRIFMDFATVGASVMAELSGNMVVSTKSMADFVREARNTGKIRAWIMDAIQGAKDLKAALGNIGAVLGEVFRQFGAGGEDGLARFREMTETFREWFHEVSNGGNAVGAFADRLGTLSDKYVNAVVYAFQKFQPALANIMPWIEDVALGLDQGIGRAADIIAPILKVIGRLLQGELAEGMRSFADGVPGVEQVVNVFEGLVDLVDGPLASFITSMAQGAITMVILIKAFKLVAGAVTPLLAGLAAMRIAAVGTVGALGTMIGALRNTAAGAVLAGTAMGRFGSAVYVIGRYIPVLAKMQMAFMQVRVAILGVGAAAAQASVGMRALAVSAGLAAAAARGMQTAFQTALALVGGPVGAIALALAGLAYAFFDASKSAREFGQSVEDQMRDSEEAVRRLVAAFEEAGGIMGESVFAAIDTNTQDYMATLERMESRTPGIFAKIGAGLNSIATIWGGGQWAQGTRDMDNLGKRSEGARKAVEGLKGGVEAFNEAIVSDSAFDKVADELEAMGQGGVDALTDLNAMRAQLDSVKEGMALLGPDTVNLGEALAVLADESATAADRLDAMRLALTALGILETTAEAAAFDLAEAVTEVADGALAAADANQALGTALFNSDGSLKASEPNARKLREELQVLGTQMLNTAAAGGDVDAAWANMQPGLQALADAFKIPLPDIQALARQFGVVPDTLRVLVAVKGVDEAQQELVAFGEMALQYSGQGPVNLNVQLKTEEARNALSALGIELELLNADTSTYRAVNVSTEQAQAAIQTLKLAGIDLGQLSPKINVGVNGAPAAEGDLAAVEGAAAGVDGAQATIDATVTNADQAKAALENLGTVAREQIPPVRVEVSQSGAEPTRDAVQQTADAANRAQEAFGEYAGGVAASMGQAAGEATGRSQEATAALESAAAAANASGTALGQGFAAGIASQVDAVQAAALQLAEAASAPLPRSPAKIGPFSGRGWTPFRGMSLAKGFAEGIGNGTGLVGDQAMMMANAVQAAIEGIRTQFGFVNPEPVALRDQIGDNKYIRNDKTDAELKEENRQKIEERIASDEKSRIREEQKKAKDDAEKAMWEAKYPEKAEDAKEKSAEQQAKEAAKDAEQADKKAYEDEKKAAEDRLKSALLVLEEGNSDAAVTAGAVEELRKQGFPSDEATVKALNDLGGRDSTDADVVNGLGVLDNTIKNEGDIERKETLEALRDATMGRRGVEEYDPFEGASENILDDSVAIGNDLLGLYDTVKQGLGAAKDLGKLLIRGFSSTDDITTAIDGVQSIASAFGNIASTVGNVVSTVGSIAAALGSAIPGIGQVAAGIGMFTSALGSANGLIDLAQDVFKLGGQIMGGFLSKIAGGADGALMGDVKMLLDTNSGELKRWSADNPDDKRSTKVMQGTGKTTNTGVENLNIYQGPGQDPYRMVDSAMFAVKAASQGAYA